jgi:hypothetical protein
MDHELYAMIVGLHEKIDFITNKLEEISPSKIEPEETPKKTKRSL